MTDYEYIIRWSQKGKCYRCKQKMKPEYAGLYDLTQYMHDTYEYKVKYNIHSCPYCGKDLEL